MNQNLKILKLFIRIPLIYNYLKLISFILDITMNYQKKKANKRASIQSEIDVKDFIVIDNGTDTIKIGMSGSDYPQIIIDTVSGIVELNSQSQALPPKKIFFGEQLKQNLIQKKYNLRLSYPIVNSRIEEKDLDQMANLWMYAITELLQIEVNNANIMLIDSPANNKQYKAKLAQIFFTYDKLKVNSCLFMNSSTLSLFSTGATTGFVTQLGHGTSTVVPVYEGFILQHALQKSNISGNFITKTLQEELKNQKIEISANNPIEHNSIIRGIKQKMCKIAENYQFQLNSPDKRDQQQKSYELPDGQVIQLSKKTVFRPGEIIFNPKIIGKEGMGLIQMMKDSLNRCDPQLANQMIKNIVVCGGSSITKGIQQRLEKQFKNEQGKFNFVLDWQRRYSSWIGGSMIGSLSTFQNLAIKRSDYEQATQNKASIIYKKCF